MDMAGTRRWGKRAGIAICGLLFFLLLAMGGLFVWLGMDSSRRLLLGFVEDVLAGQGLYLKIDRTAGQLPFDLRLGGVSLADADGVWLELDAAGLDLNPFRLFGLTVQVDSLRLEGLRLSRLPVLRGVSGHDEPDMEEGLAPGGLALPVDIRLDEFALDGGRVDTRLLRALLPEQKDKLPRFDVLDVSARASAEVRRGAIMEPGKIMAELHAAVDTGSGRLLELELYTGPGGGLPDSLRLDLRLSETENGLLADLGGLERLPAYELRLTSASSLRDIRLDLNLHADRLADVAGRIFLAPAGGGAPGVDSLSRLLTPNWQGGLALKAKPGPLLFELGSPFAVLPADLSGLVGPELELAVDASSDFTGDAGLISLGELRLENSLFSSGLSGGSLRITGRERVRLDLDGVILVRIKNGKFFEIFGLQSADTPLLGQSSLRLVGKAGLELGGDTPPQVEFAFNGPLEAESFIAGVNPENLAFNLELNGKFSDALTLDVLHLEGMGLMASGRSHLVPAPFALDLELDVSGDARGGWTGVLPGLDVAAQGLGFKGTLAAGLDSGQNIAARLNLSVSGLNWPLPGLERAVGSHAALQAEFSGPLGSPYTVRLKGLSAGPEPLEPSVYDPDAPFEAFAGLRARGEAEISLPGVSPHTSVQGWNAEDLARLASVSGSLDLAVADVGAFLPESSGFDGAVRVSASAGGVIGGQETALRLEAGLSNLAEPFETPMGDLTLSLDTVTDLTLQDGLGLLGRVRLNSVASGAGAFLLDADFEASRPEGGVMRAEVRDLRSSFAGLTLQGGAGAVFSAEGTDPPGLSGKFTARLENWKDFNATLAGLAPGLPPVSGAPLELALELDSLPAGQKAGLSLSLERLYLALDSATELAALPAPEGGEPSLGVPGLLAIRGIEGRADALDLWKDRLVAARLQTGAGSLGVEEWASAAFLLDLAGKAGRVNMAVRNDGEALGFLRGLGTRGVDFTPELVDASLRDDGRPVEGLFAASVGLDAYMDEAEAARAAAGNGTLKMAMLSGVFRLDPLTLSLDRAALFMPELGAGLYLLHPTFMRVGHNLRVRNLNFALLPGGYIRADALFSEQRSRARAEVKDFPLALVRKLTGLPLPDGELGLNSRLSISGVEITGRSELGLVLRPAGGRPEAGDAAKPMLLSLQGTFSQSSGEFKLPTAPGVMRFTGSGALGGLEPDEPEALRLAFDVPFRQNAEGLLLPDPEETLAATLNWRGDLGRIWPLVPVADRYLGGMADLDLRLGGSLSSLKYDGTAYLAGGRYEDLTLGLVLEGIDIEAATSGQGSRLLLAAGDGEGGKIALEARIADNGVLDTGLGGGIASKMPQLEARGQISGLAPLHRDDVYLRLSGLVDAAGPLLTPLVSGKFEVEQGNINLLYNLGGGVSSLPVEEKSAAKVEQRPSEDGPRLDISVEAPRRFFVRGPIIDSEWKASAVVRGPVSNPEFSALISPVRGNVDLISRPFSLAGGQINVWNDGASLGSALDLLLTYNGASLTAEIRAGGSIRRPTLRLSSTPPLPQDQILSRVLFGKDITQLSAIEAVQVADGVRRLMSLGQGGFDFLGEMRGMLGVDTLRIGSAGGGGAQAGNISGSPDASAFGVGGGESEQDAAGATVEAGKYINDSIYVGVEQGTTESSTRVRVEVELKPNLTLQGSSGGNSSQVGLGWKKDY